jgi:hypothetical protein
MTIPIEFLEKLRPGGPWLLVAISPEGVVVGKSCSTAADAEEFIVNHNGRSNLYYQVAQTRDGLNSKAKKGDVVAVKWVWTEIDPDLPERLEAEITDEFRDAAAAAIASQKEAALVRARSYDPPPTAILDSGNGIQVLWGLDAAQPINGAASYDAIELRNKHILRKLDGDPACWNIDRVLRLPGTANLPTLKKRKQGKVRCQTKLIEFNANTYPVIVFPAASPEPRSAGAGSSACSFDQSAFESIALDDPRIAGLDERWKKIGFEAKDIDGLDIALKYGPEGSGTKRSGAVIAFAKECFKRQIDENVVASMLMGWKIGQHIRDQHNPMRALGRAISKAKEYASGFEQDRNGRRIKESQRNIRVALHLLGVTLSYNEKISSKLSWKITRAKTPSTLSASFSTRSPGTASSGSTRGSRFTATPMTMPTPERWEESCS